MGFFKAWQSKRMSDRRMSGGAKARPGITLTNHAIPCLRGPNAPTGNHRKTALGNGTGKRQRFELATMGFFKAWQSKRMIGSGGAKARPGITLTNPAIPGLRGFILPPWPGYPLLGCSPAEPNSVSPGNRKYNMP